MNSSQALENILLNAFDNGESVVLLVYCLAYVLLIRYSAQAKHQVSF